jgi:hypothetical protein
MAMIAPPYRVDCMAQLLKITSVEHGRKDGMLCQWKRRGTWNVRAGKF